MSAADKTKLDGVAASANNYTHPTSNGNKHIPADGSAGQFLKYDSAGTAVWAADNNTVYTHPNHSGEVTSTADGAQVIASNVVDEDNLKVSNSPTNGYFLSAQSGNTGGLTWAEVAAGGITEADQWCMNSDWAKSSSGWADVDSNWSRPTGTGTANGTNLGTGMTHSSGVFTFPSTGFWLVRLHATGYNSSDLQYWQISIGTVGGTYHSEATASIADQGSSDWYESQSTEAIFDVTDVTSDDFKIKFRIYTNGSMNLDGADQMRTGFTFIKLADT